ncbi:MAG: virulence-associated E family protein [Bradyrhizobium sp.]|nr:MAG: virulence-associated E family protein [Bradyrhizobium sp.]
MSEDSVVFVDFSTIANAQQEIGPHWIEKCLMEHGKPVNNLANVLIALRFDPRLCDAIAWDEMQQRPFLMKPLDGVDHPAFVARPLTDYDVSKIQETLQVAGLKTVGKDVVHSAVDQRAHERSFHPVRDYLDGLAWDGVERLDSWLTDYLGAEHSPYTAGVGKMFLIGTVARILKPGCKVDHMLVLEGSQGAKKSTACAILGGPWFSDSLPDVNAGKDVSQHLAGKWVIEIPEMSAMSKGETAHLKAFITRTVEKYRPSYGRKEVSQPRQCVFIGTTNNSTYLRDETGGRRFWPVKIGTIDTIALSEQRDQLFAEAVKCYLEGETWHPDAKFEKEIIFPEQEDRYEPDAWEGPIRDYLQENAPEKVYLGEIFQHALAIEVTGRDRGKQNRVTAILTRLHWGRLKKDSNGNIPWGPPTG